MKNENIKNARKTENQWNVCNLKVHSNFSSIKKDYTHVLLRIIEIIFSFIRDSQQGACESFWWALNIL